MKILLGQAYHLRLDPKNWATMELFPPLGSLYAAAVLRQMGHDVVFCDSMLAENTEGWKAAISREMPDLAVLYEDNFNYLTKMCLLNMRDAAGEMIAAANKLNVPVVVAGSDATDQPAAYFDLGASVVIRGEGEVTLKEVVNAFENDGWENLESIAGLALPDEQGKTKQTAKRPVIRNVDDLPMPAWDLVNLDQYRAMWEKHRGVFELNLVSSRGCPFHCNWCAKPIWGRAYNVRSAEKIADEMALLKEKANPRRLWMMDDIFAMKPGWAADLAKALEERKVKLPFKCLSRADLLLRKGEVEALAKAGCEELWIGAESGSQKILDAMEKGTALEEIDIATEKLRKAGIEVGYFIQYGYPGENWADIKATFKLLRKNMPDKIGVSVSYPLPGTSFHERVMEQLGTQKNWQHADDLLMMYKGPYNTGFYRVLHRYTHRINRFYKGTAAPLKRTTNGTVNYSGTLRYLAGTLVSAAYVAALWPQLQFRRLTSGSGMKAIEPKLSRDAAGIGSISSNEGG